MRSVVVVIGTVLALVGCTGDDPSGIEEDPVAAGTTQDGTPEDDATAEDDAGEEETAPTPPSTDDLGALLAFGAWQDRNLVVWRFSADGTYTVQSGQYETGIWELDDTVLTIETDDGSEYCAGTTATYQLTAVGTDEVEVEVLDDPCEERNEGLSAGALRQLGD